MMLHVLSAAVSSFWMKCDGTAPFLIPKLNFEMNGGSGETHLFTVFLGARLIKSPVQHPVHSALVWRARGGVEKGGKGQMLLLLLLQLRWCFSRGRFGMCFGYFCRRADSCCLGGLWPLLADFCQRTF